jgi:hypothetical protein
MSGRRSRNKGARTERAIAKVLQANGFAAVKVSRAYQPGHDIVLPMIGRDLSVEVKARADGAIWLLVSGSKSQPLRWRNLARSIRALKPANTDWACIAGCAARLPSARICRSIRLKTLAAARRLIDWTNDGQSILWRVALVGIA